MMDHGMLLKIGGPGKGWYIRINKQNYYGWQEIINKLREIK